ncbi:MAG TPA: translocation/assembly module TamB domain-containing protein [Bacteroidia bacterium]|jgi:hypothetical protein|nr:translocation/assembly module TamB domain-containing protein [Bacteroidia bacterium]
MQQKPAKGKVRRFIWRFVKITLITVLLLGSLFYGLLQMHSVQTWLGKEASAYLSKALKTKISIDAIKINFFKTVDLEGIYVEDLHQDTLLYGHNLGCEIAMLSFSNKKMELDLTHIKGITIKLQQYKGEKNLNFQFLIDYFASPGAAKKDTSKSSFQIHYGDLQLTDVSFVYKNHNDTSKVNYGVNFSDLEARNLSGKISDINIAGGIIKCRVEELSLNEKSGLQITKLFADATVSAKSIRADNLILITPNSYLHGYYQMHTDSFGSYGDFLNKVRLAVKLTDSSYVNPIDISYFARVFKGFDEKIKISGIFDGPVSDLKTNDLKFSAYEYTAFDGSFEIKGLPDVNKTYLKVNAEKLSTHYNDLIRVPAYPFDEGKDVVLPANIKKLGRVIFSGKTEGYLNDLFIAGVFNTALGQIISEANIRTPQNKEPSYSGNFKTENFNIGSLIESPQVGEISLNAKINASGNSLNTLAADINGQVQAARYNGYTYHKFDINGNFKNKHFTGLFSSADTNAHFNFIGNLDLTKKIPQINAGIEIFRFDLFRCHFLQSDSTAVLSGLVNVNLNGQNPEDINGSLQASQVKLVKSNGIVKLDNTDIQITQNETQNSLSMISSVLDAEVNGKFTAATLQKSLSDFLHAYFPTFFTDTLVAVNTRDKKQKTNTDNFKFKVRVKDFTPLATFLKMPLAISPNTIVQGSFDAQKNSLIVSGISDLIEYSKTPVKDWFLSVNTSNKQVQLNTGFRRVDLGDSLYVGNFNISLGTTDNKSDFRVTWDNQSKHKNSGEIDGKLIFTKHSLDLNLGKFLVFTEDSLWQMTGNDHFIVDSSGIFNFHDLVFVNGNQRVKLEGIISQNPKEQFTIDLENFQLFQLNVLLKSRGVNLQGSLTGMTSISDLYNHVIFSSALNFKALAVNKTLIGTGEINSFFDKNKNVVSINGFFKRDFAEIKESSYNNINFDGYYYPAKKDSALDVNIHLTQFALNTLQPFVKDIFTFNQGHINGEISIKGSLSKPQMRGDLEVAEVKNFKVDYLNTYYEIKSGKIKIEPDEITLNFIDLYDIHGNKGVVYGNIFHDNFTKMKLDFDINVTNFMALNTTALQNSSYYGKAFCTGNIGLYGSPDALTFEINAKTAKGTQFYIPLSGPGEVSESGFIRFVKADSAGKKSPGDKTDFSGITLKFNLEVTPNAEVQILLDAKSGDAIKARGIGNITMNISTHGNFEMFGTYDILDGSYLFTLENVINKKFDIDEGSDIRWSGDPLNADINITAKYRQRTSLAAFFPQTTSAASDQAAGSGTASTSTAGVDNNKRYPVDCKLFMRGKLLNPDITFGIDLPGVSEVLRSQVMGYINNDQELNRQVFSLLLLRTFVTPLQLTNTSGVTAGDAVGNNASELLSNQINSWLSHFTKLFNMGVNYRPSGAQSNGELDVNVSTQLFNDKLTIDGNVGVNNNSQTKTSTLIGDLNVNYKLSHDGKVQLKAFNRSNDNFQIATLGGQFTQGAGVFYREEFNTLNDLYKRYLNFLSRKKKKAQQAGSS